MEDEGKVWRWLEEQDAHRIYLELLNLNWGTDEADRYLPRLQELARQLDGRAAWRGLFLHTENWRLHLLGAGVLLAARKLAHQHLLESRLEKGTMVDPQLAAALGLLHREDAVDCLARLARLDGPLDAARSEAARQVLARLRVDPVGLGLVQRPSVLVKSAEESLDSFEERLIEHLDGSPYSGLGSYQLFFVHDERTLAQHVVGTYWDFWSARLS